MFGRDKRGRTKDRRDNWPNKLVREHIRPPASLVGEAGGHGQTLQALGAVVRCLASDDHVVDMRLAQARRRDADKLGPTVQLRD